MTTTTRPLTVIEDGGLSALIGRGVGTTLPTHTDMTRALPDARIAEILQTAAITGNDPHLDELLLRLHIQTACRRGGARPAPR